MSRGGSGRGGGASAVTGVRAIANVLGISRQEVSQYTQQIGNEPLPLYPPLTKDPLPLGESKELVFMCDAKQEFLHRFRESSFYHRRTGKRDVRRYTDKYRLMDKEPFEPHWERLPAELNWRSTVKGNPGPKSGSKRLRMDENQLLEKLGQNEKRTVEKQEGEEDEGRAGEEDEDENALKMRAMNGDEEEANYSDEDFVMEGANDYVDTYFDGGEGYEDEGNPDDEAAY